MSKKHTILMLLCCLVGMGAAAAIFFFGIPVNRVFTVFLILLCPLSHFFMMKFMMKGGHDHGDNGHPVNESHHALPTPANENR
jgi:fatty acid desaturase